MLGKRNKAISTIISGLLATTIVTACVKNGSKDEDPQTQGVKTMEISELSGNELNGIVPVILNEDSGIATAKLIKEYSFQINEVREFRVHQGEIKNSECRDGGPFIYSFSLKSADGQERPIHSKRNPELLSPGAYRLRVEIENGSLCKKVAMEINVRTKVRSDLTMTKNEERGYQCYDVVENGAVQSRASVRINTKPMRIVKYQQIQSGATREQMIVDGNTLCGRELKENASCVDSLNPAAVQEGPVSAIKRICGSNSKENARAFGRAELQVNRRAQNRSAQFSCRHRRKILSFNLSNCELIFNMGEKLPIRAGSAEIVVRRDKMRINFNIQDNSIEEDDIQNRLYVAIVQKRDDSYYELVSDSFPEISKEDLLDGQIVIPDTNIRRKVMAIGVDNISVIISKRRNMRNGVYSINIGQLCQNDKNLIIEKKGGNTNNLCE